MKKILTILLLMLTTLIYGEGWKDQFEYLTEDDISDLEAGKYADRVNVDYKDGLKLLPKDNDFYNEILDDLENYDPELCVEMLYLIDRPQAYLKATDEELMVYLLNNLRAFSDQKGLEYYSSNRKRMHLLFKESHFVLNDNKTKTKDPVVKKLPEFDKRNYYQKDTSFGSNVYSLTTKTKGRTIWIQTENIKSLTVLGLVKAVESGGVKTNFVLMLEEDNILIYSLAQIKKEPKIKKVLMFKVNISGSFKTRMNSIVTWFKGRI